MESQDREQPSDEPPSFWESAGMVAAIITGDVGRAVAVVGALLVGFRALGTYGWIHLAIAGATFCGIAWACRK